MYEIFRILGEPSRVLRVGLLVFWLIGLIGLWIFTPNHGIPLPIDVLETFQRMAKTESIDSSNLFYNTRITLQLNFFGLLLSSIISLLISYLSCLPLLQPLNQILQWLRYLPIVAVNLFFLSIFTIGLPAKIAMLTAGMAFFLITSMTAEIRKIPKQKIELARILNYGNLKTFWLVVFRPTLPAMIDIVSQSVALSWLLVVAVELFNQPQGGIIAAIYSFTSTDQRAEIFVYLIIIGIIAFLEVQFFYWLKRILFSNTQIAERA